MGRGWALLLLLLSHDVISVSQNVASVGADYDLERWAKVVSDDKVFQKVNHLVELLDKTGILQPVVKLSTHEQRLSMLKALSNLAPGVQKILNMIPESAQKHIDIGKAAEAEVLLQSEPQVFEILGQPPISLGHPLFDPKQNPAFNVFNRNMMVSYNQNPLFQAAMSTPQGQKVMATLPPEVFKLDYVSLAVIGTALIGLVLMKGMKDKLYCENHLDKKIIAEQISSAREQLEELESVRPTLEADMAKAKEGEEEEKAPQAMRDEMLSIIEKLDDSDLTPADKKRLKKMRLDPCGDRPSYRDDREYIRAFKAFKSALIKNPDAEPPEILKHYVELEKERKKKKKAITPVVNSSAQTSSGPTNLMSQLADQAKQFQAHGMALLDSAKSVMMDGAGYASKMVNQDPEQFCASTAVQSQPGFVMMELFLQRFRSKPNTV